MKRIIITLCILLASAAAAKAQDRIVLTDGQEILAKVTEVTPEFIKYKKIVNPNGPLYTTFIADVASITYENGQTELFNAPEPAAQAAPDAPEAPAEPAPEPPAEVPAPAPEDPSPVYRTQYYDVRYSDIRGLYDTRYYRDDTDDPYSPAAAGVASFLIPGLGQCIDGEWLRGLGIVATNIGFGTLEVIETSAIMYSISTASQYEYKYGSYGYGSYYANRSGSMAVAGLGALLITGAAQLAFNIWNICDAVEIAKVKNMYCRDMSARTYALDMHFAPSLECVPSGGAIQPVAGVSLCLKF